MVCYSRGAVIRYGENTEVEILRQTIYLGVTSGGRGWSASSCPLSPNSDCVFILWSHRVTSGFQLVENTTFFIVGPDMESEVPNDLLGSWGVKAVFPEQ